MVWLQQSVGSACHAAQLTRHAQLLQNLGRGSRRDRVAAKFVESEFEKVDRLMEIYTVGLPAMACPLLAVLDAWCRLRLAGV